MTGDHARRALDDLERALEGVLQSASALLTRIDDVVDRKVEEALRRHGIGSEQATEPAASVHGGVPIRPTPDLVQCPSCGYEFRPSESWSSATIEGESTGYGTSHTEGSAEGSGSSRSRSIVSQSTTEGITETETGTESVSGTSYPE